MHASRDSAVKLMFRPFRRYARFSGRARRAEFWWFVLLVFVLVVVAGVADRIAFDDGQAGPVTWLVLAGTIVPFLAVGARRLHDCGITGWWQLSYVTLFGVVWTAILCAQDGVWGPNRFGPDPLGREPRVEEDYPDLLEDDV